MSNKEGFTAGCLLGYYGTLLVWHQTLIGAGGCPVKVFLGKAVLCIRRGLAASPFMWGQRQYDGCGAWMPCKSWGLAVRCPQTQILVLSLKLCDHNLSFFKTQHCCENEMR